MTEWKDIESAPKDGTRVLLYLWWVKEVHVGRWLANKNGAAWRIFFSTQMLRDQAHKMNSSIIYGEPSHWMPLPPPPSAE